MANATALKSFSFTVEASSTTECSTSMVSVILGMIHLIWIDKANMLIHVELLATIKKLSGGQVPIFLHPSIFSATVLMLSLEELLPREEAIERESNDAKKVRTILVLFLGPKSIGLETLVLSKLREN